MLDQTPTAWELNSALSDAVANRKMGDYSILCRAPIRTTIVGVPPFPISATWQLAYDQTVTITVDAMNLEVARIITRQWQQGRLRMTHALKLKTALLELATNPGTDHAHS